MDLYRILSSVIRNAKKGLPRPDRIRIRNNNWSELLFISLTRYDIRHTTYEKVVPKVGVEPTRAVRLAGF